MKFRERAFAKEVTVSPVNTSDLRSGAVPKKGAVGALADQLPVSRPAVSQHLRVLKQAELVIESVSGTRRLYRINRAGLMVVRDYFDRLWETTLDNFALLAAAEAAADNRNAPSDLTAGKRPDKGLDPTTRKEH